jgi:hypothetical protein
VQSVGRNRHREYSENGSSKNISVSFLSTTHFLFIPRQIVDNQRISQNAMDKSTDRSTQPPNSAQPSSATSAGITKVGTTRRSAKRQRNPTRPSRVPTQKVTNPPIGQFYARSTTEDGEILPVDPVFKFPVLRNSDMIVEPTDGDTGHPRRYAISSYFRHPDGSRSIAPRFDADQYTSFECVPEQGYRLHQEPWGEKGGTVYGARPIEESGTAGGEPSATASQN